MIIIGSLLFIGMINLIIAIFIYIFGYRLAHKYYLSAKYLAYTFVGLAIWSWSLTRHKYFVENNFNNLFNYNLEYINLFIVYASTGIAIYTLLMFGITWGITGSFDIKKYNFLKWTTLIVLMVTIIPKYGLVIYNYNIIPNKGSFGHFVYMVYIISYFALFNLIISKKYNETRLYRTKQYMNVLIKSIYFSCILAIISNLLIPFIFKTSDVSYSGPMFLMFMGITVIFAIYKYEIFGIKKEISNTLILLSFTMAMFIVRLIFSFIKNGQLNLFDLVSILVFLVVNIFIMREVYYGAKKQIILDRKKVQLDSLLKVKNSFMQVSSHQLRTPLTVVMGYLSMLVDPNEKQYVISKETREDLEKVYISSKNLNEIINDLLFATDINMGKFTLNIKDEVSLNTVVKNILEDKQYLLDEKKTTVVLKEEGPKQEILIDQPKIKEAFNNVLDNAVYYGKGMIWLTINSKKKDFIYVEFKDNGVGISREDSQKIWKKFERGTNSSLINPNGSGLGLYLAKMILLKHGGDITIESKGKDQGSSVIFKIPKDTRKYASKDSFK